MFRIIPLLAIIPATVLLAISFFVLVVQKKQESQGMKTFGLVIAVLLWLASAMVFSMGIIGVAIGPKCHHGMSFDRGCHMERENEGCCDIEEDVDDVQDENLAQPSAQKPPVKK